MENKQAIMNMKQGKNIPYKHETITTLFTMADKLEKIEQIINAPIMNNQADYIRVQKIREILEKE